MDTVKRIPINKIENTDNIQLADLTDDEHLFIGKFIDLTRDVTEANQLFEAFYCNLLCMRHMFDFRTNDTAPRTKYCPEFDSDWIAINSQVVNFISSAKTLTEFLREAAEIWLKKPNSKQDKYTDDFNAFVSKIYDGSFNYRLLINLRNFMQHGYLPVSFQDGRYSFDAIQILTSPHFDVKGQLKKDLENFLSKCEIQGKNIACLSLTNTLANFTVSVIDIYRKFLFYISDNVSSFYKNLQKLIQEKPSIVCDYHEAFEGYIFYEWDEYTYTYHTFNSNDNPNKMIAQYQKRVADIYKDEKKAWDAMFESLKNNGKPLKIGKL